jgi:nucleotide-binding universal stress UspA family protein
VRSGGLIIYKIQNILCPIDFSEASLIAVRYALNFVHQHNASITLMYVDEFEQTPQGAFERDTHVQLKHYEASAEFADEQLRKIIKSFEISQERVKTIVKFGAAYKEIILEAERGEYTTIILSVQGIGNSTPHLIGRTAERIVRLCRIPVITIRPDPDKIFSGIKSILVPTDFSEYSNYSIPYAISLALMFTAKLILLHVTDISVSEEYISQLKFPDLSYFDKKAKNLDVETLVGRDIEPENSIVNVAEDRAVDMIIMGTHGGRGMRRTQIGNTTEEIVRRVTIPVLSITHPVHKMIFPRRFNEPLPSQSAIA